MECQFYFSFTAVARFLFEFAAIYLGITTVCYLLERRKQRSGGIAR